MGREIRRRIEHKQQLVSEGKRLIIKYLSADRFFQHKIDNLANKYPEMVHMPTMEYPFPVKDHADMVSNIASIDTTRIEAYSYALHELADSVNLRCDWALNELHTLVRETIIKATSSSGEIFHLTGWTTKVIDHLVLDVPIYPETRKFDIDKIVAREWQRIKGNHPELKKRMKVPLYFDLQIKWLCRRLVNGHTGERIKRLFKDSEHYDDEYIDLSIRRTARLLGIKLPIGRPPKPKKR